MIGRAFGILPTDDRIKNLSPFQSLWLYAHIRRESNAENKRQWDVVKFLAAVINPAMAKQLLKDDTDSVVTVNESFENDLKNIDPGFDMAEYKAQVEGLE